MAFLICKITFLSKLVCMFQEWVSLSRAILWNDLHFFLLLISKRFDFQPHFGCKMPNSLQLLWHCSQGQPWLVAGPYLQGNSIHLHSHGLYGRGLPCYCALGPHHFIRNMCWNTVPWDQTHQNGPNQATQPNHRTHVGGTVDVDLEIKALRVVDKARSGSLALEEGNNHPVNCHRTMENGHRNSEFSHKKCWFSIV